MADSLWGVLPAELVYVRAANACDEDFVEVARTGNGPASTRGAKDVGRQVRAWMQAPGKIEVLEIPRDDTGQMLRLVSIPIRHSSTVGQVAVGSRNSQFPTDLHNVLLMVCVNQATIAIENTRLYEAAQQELNERVRAEELLREMNETLELRVADRTLELERAVETLRQRNLELQDFAYVASHDLQEPIRKIRTFSEMLRTDAGASLNTEGAEHLERIERASERMHALIQDLLTFSRVQTHAQPFTHVDLNEVLHAVLSDHEMTIVEKNGQIALGATLPVIEADAMQMRQLLSNMIGNALKFHRPDVPPVIEIDASVEERESPNSADSSLGICLISIRDNGIGFEEKYRSRIFMPFQRLHGLSIYPGTGMGLAICQRIAERHRGSVTASSTPGLGSCFTIALPLRQPTATAEWM